MSLFGADTHTLDDLFVHGLKTIYYAERQILETLPQMIEMATDPQLKAGFQQHLRETEGQRTRLEQVFRMHGVEADETKCPAIDGIIKAANATAADIDDKQVLDAALAFGAQMVEHYEIAQYGTLIAWARELGRSDCAAVLDENLAEEKATDAKLTDLAEARINRAAEMQAS
ncbi:MULTISPECIES: ferritin-like domain-containing protein [Sphingomonas]|uniref:Ferritin-like domain-containing protein n=1 Tax=Sphingomonas molluscorum TaxID=418184 RepID=A0ABU8Q172_9SPHN|nr:ferritin-like domain-containing protein [Sphingomonas sp. JUb134]MBM7404998.1 ferritin-like metal-binding protein YciE [Sphingomonas sp. JUb134]